MSVRLPSTRTGWLGIAATTAVVTVLAVAISALAHERPRRPLDLAGYALLLAGSLAVAGRRWPVLAFLVSLAAIGTYQALGYPTASPYFLALLFTAYAAAAPRHRVRTMLLALLTFLVFGLAALALRSPEVAYTIPLLTAIAFAAGQVASELRVASARREEQARRQQELQLLTEERVRIARELHDVVSHSIAMIGVRAGVAAHLLDREPEQAREALNAIKAASKDALRDLRGILGVLSEVEDGEPRRPAPGVERLPELVESVRRAGVPVELDLDGELTPLPAATDLAVYRIVQEALTNVIRYAPGASARVCVRFTAEEVGLDVVDDGRAAAGAVERPHGSGRGLAGMRERASAAGGRLEVGPDPGGGFAVHAWLPAAAAAA